jgi:YVTN family beta-propeller protein
MDRLMDVGRRAVWLVCVAGVMIGVLGGLAAAADAASGWTAYVTEKGGNVMTQISTASDVTFGTAIPVGSGPEEVAITPDGSTAYVTNNGGNSVTPINLATGTPGTAISVGTMPIGVAITPKGQTAYVVNNGGNSVTPINLATNTPGTAIPVGAAPQEAAITPDGSTAYVTNAAGNSVTPINVATNTPGTAIPVGSEPFGVAIVPDQAPTAAFSTVAEPAGQPSSFDASQSSSPVGSIARYVWEFGDGQTATTTVPVTQHVYATSGTHTVRLTVTNTAGTSLVQVFTGQTVSNQGGPQATSAHAITTPAPSTTTPQPTPTPEPTPTPQPSPRVSQLIISPRQVSTTGRRRHGRCVTATATNDRDPSCQRPIRLHVRYTLTAAATITLTLSQRHPGRTTNHRCVAPTARNDRHARCTRLTAIGGQLRKTVSAGTHSLTLTGRLDGGALSPGSYQMTITPRGAPPRSAAFSITH